MFAPAIREILCFDGLFNLYVHFVTSVGYPTPALSHSSILRLLLASVTLYSSVVKSLVLAAPSGPFVVMSGPVNRGTIRSQSGYVGRLDHRV